MANDGSIPSLIEDAIVAKIIALQFNGDNAFKTVEVWKGQIAPGNAGIEAFSRYSPFAFVSYEPEFPGREGDGDLRKVMGFSVAIGQVSSADGVCRFGDATHPGTNILEDLVIDALDNVHPGTGIACDDLRFDGSIILTDDLRRRAIQLNFKANRMTVS
jgi:hypothetical protein